MPDTALEMRMMSLPLQRAATELLIAPPGPRAVGRVEKIVGRPYLGDHYPDTGNGLVGVASHLARCPTAEGNIITASSTISAWYRKTSGPQVIAS